VSGSEDAVIPGSVGTIDVGFFVIGEIVSEDLGLGRIGGFDRGAAMDNAVRLIEIYRLSDVVGDDGVILPEFCDAIDLHSE